MLKKAWGVLQRILQLMAKEELNFSAWLGSLPFYLQDRQHTPRSIPFLVPFFS